MAGPPGHNPVKVPEGDHSDPIKPLTNGKRLRDDFSCYLGGNGI